MTSTPSTIRLSDAADGGTDLIATHDGLNASVPPADKETGWLAGLAEEPLDERT